MNLKKLTAIVLTVSTAIVGLSACSAGQTASASSSASAAQSQNSSRAQSAQSKKIVIGILAREKPDIDYVAEKLKSRGYDLETKVFNDNVAMNMATADGSIDVNYFQNKPYLESFNKSKGTDLISYGPEIFYTKDLLVSKKYKTLASLPQGAKIGVANDQTNRARELQLLAANGLITLKEGVKYPTVLDITQNTKKFNFIEIDPRSRVGAFPDLDAMTAPSITVYQMNDQQVTVKGALCSETPDAYKKYGGIVFAVKKGNDSQKWLKKAVEIMTTKDYATWLENTYKGAKIPLSET